MREDGSTISIQIVQRGSQIEIVNASEAGIIVSKTPQQAIIAQQTKQPSVTSTSVIAQGTKSANVDDMSADRPLSQDPNAIKSTRVLEPTKSACVLSESNRLDSNSATQPYSHSNAGRENSQIEPQTKISEHSNVTSMKPQNGQSGSSLQSPLFKEPRTPIPDSARSVFKPINTSRKSIREFSSVQNLLKGGPRRPRRRYSLSGVWMNFKQLTKDYRRRRRSLRPNRGESCRNIFFQLHV